MSVKKIKGIKKKEELWKDIAIINQRLFLKKDGLILQASATDNIKKAAANATLICMNSYKTSIHIQYMNINIGQSVLLE